MKKILHLGIGILILSLFSTNSFGQSDIYISDVISPVNACTHTDTEMVSIIIKIANSDTLPTNDTIAFEYTINGTTTVNDTLFLSSDFYPADSIIFEFGTTTDLSATGTYSFNIICFYNHDVINTNDTINFDVNTFGFPITTVTNDTTICEGKNVTLNVSGGTDYTWNTGDSTSTIIVTPEDSTMYIVTTADLNNCSTIDTINVYVNPNPTITFNVSDTSTACVGTDYIYTVSGGDSYYWNTGDNTSSISVSPADTMIYSVVVSSNGCTSTDSILVNAIAPTYTLIPDTFTSNGDSIT